MRAKSVLLVFFLVLVGCASSVNDMMKSWEGHSAEDLIAKWGVPSIILDNPGGPGKILVYNFHTQYTTPEMLATPGRSYTTGYIDANGNWQSTTTYTPGLPGTPASTYEYEKSRVFFIDERGVI